MITDFEKMIYQGEHLKETRNAIAKAKGRIVVLIHPLFSSVGYSPKKYREYGERLKKLIKKSKFPVFLFLEDEPVHMERGLKILEGINIEGQEIILVKTFEDDPTPILESIPETNEFMLQKELCRLLKNILGVKRIILGGESGTLNTEAGCIPYFARFIRRYSDIKIIPMPSMMFDFDNIDLSDLL